MASKTVTLKDGRTKVRVKYEGVASVLVSATKPYPSLQYMVRVRKKDLISFSYDAEPAYSYFEKPWYKFWERKKYGRLIGINYITRLFVNEIEVFREGNVKEREF